MKRLTICLSVLLVCTFVLIAGCEKKTEPVSVQEVKACPADCSKPCCAAEGVKTCCGDDPSKCCASKEGAKACPADCTKPCCAKDAKACPAGCTKPCCAIKTATDAVEEVAKTCCGADPTKCCGKAAVEAVEKAAGDVKDAIDPHAGHNH